MKTISKLMALCLLLGTLAFAQDTGGDKEKKGGETKTAASGKKATKSATKTAKKGAKKAATTDTSKGKGKGKSKGGDKDKDKTKGGDDKGGATKK